MIPLNRILSLSLSRQTVKALERYYAQEKSDMMKECMDLIRVMKYILKDEHYCDRRGELVSYVHAIRSCKKMDKGRDTMTRCYYKPSFQWERSGRDEEHSEQQTSNLVHIRDQLNPLSINNKK